ncbi:Outer membrane efflux protein [compost metagenome]
MRREARLDAAATAAGQAVALARRQYEAGMVSLLEVLDAQRSDYDIRRSLASARIDVALRWVEIYQTLGVYSDVPAAPEG